MNTNSKLDRYLNHVCDIIMPTIIPPRSCSEFANRARSLLPRPRINAISMKLMQAGPATKYISNINLLQAYTEGELIIRGFCVCELHLNYLVFSQQKMMAVLVALKNYFFGEQKPCVCELEERLSLQS
ncbi:hypothetical protein RYX36_002796 [Vicia faba]